MVNDSLFEANLVTELRQGAELLFGRMAKKDRRVMVMSHAEDLFDRR